MCNGFILALKMANANKKLSLTFVTSPNPKVCTKAYSSIHLGNATLHLFKRGI
jgi:hypothetical protein